MARPIRRGQERRSKPRKLILQNFLSPGDLVMLTAAVRDLHRTYPGEFLTDVRTSCPALWNHNPYITPLREEDPAVETVRCEYPLIHQSNRAPYHCVHGFVRFLNERLSLRIEPREFRGDIYLSRNEKSRPSQVEELAGGKFPFWLIVSGGKFDYTNKWWDPQRFQQVVHYFRDRIQFVQVGEIGHHHPRLHGTIDLRGRTDLRELIRLVYHAQGVLCGVTALMHLAAAVPSYSTRPKLRPAVIVAGGREPTHWEAYPHHQFIHTIGSLPCCESGGCWRSRVRPLGDGEDHLDESLCLDPVGTLPRCMDMISAHDVIRRVENFFLGGMTRYLKDDEIPVARRGIRASEARPNFDSTLNIFTAAAALRERLRRPFSQPPLMTGRGVVVCAVSDDLVRLARAARERSPQFAIGCFTSLPPTRVQMRELNSLGARIEVVRPERRVLVHALQRVSWREVIVLTQPRAPVLTDHWEMILSSDRFRRNGAVFWSEQSRVGPALWRLNGLEVPSARTHAGCAVLDREHCWRALELWRWMCEHPYLFIEETGSELAALEFAIRLHGTN